MFRHFEWQVAAGVCAHAGEWQAVLRLAETLEPEESSRVAPRYKHSHFGVDSVSLRGIWFMLDAIGLAKVI